jgi:ATP-dependent DNA helicase RecG
VIKIFDDKIIFINPGTIYGSLKLEDLEKYDYVSSIRNKLLAEAFYLMGDIERYRMLRRDAGQAVNYEAL